MSSRRRGSRCPPTRPGTKWPRSPGQSTVTRWPASACAASRAGATSARRSPPCSTRSVPPGGSANEDGSIGDAQIDQPEFKEALEFYVNLINDAGEDDAANASFNECLAQYRDGQVAMWYDATVAAGLLEADDSPVKGLNGYALAPVKVTEASGWLWSWALAIPADRLRPRHGVGVHQLGHRARVHRGRRRADPRWLGGHPARHPPVDLRDPRVPGGGRRLRRPDAGRHGRRADRQPGHHATARSARRAVRRCARVPGRRQPVHGAVLGGHRRTGQHRRRPERLPGHRLARSAG